MSAPGSIGFKNRRQLAAWLGLVPRQCFSVGKNTLGSISKRDDVVTNGAIVIHTQRLKSDPGGNLLS
ncbi:transposase [Escherichia coli]